MPSLHFNSWSAIKGQVKSQTGQTRISTIACYFIWQAAIHSGQHPASFTTVRNVLLPLPRVQQVQSVSLCNKILTVNVRKRHGLLGTLKMILRKHKAKK